MGPVNVDFSPTRRVIPDFFVCRGASAARSRSERKLFDPPCLIVEVVSEDSRALDTGAKRAVYQRMLADEYSIVDLDAREMLRWTPASQTPEALWKAMTWEPVSGRVDVPIDITMFVWRAM